MPNAGKPVATNPRNAKKLQGKCCFVFKSPLTFYVWIRESHHDSVVYKRVNLRTGVAFMFRGRICSEHRHLSEGSQQKDVSTMKIQKLNVVVVIHCLRH